MEPVNHNVFYILYVNGDSYSYKNHSESHLKKTITNDLDAMDQFEHFVQHGVETKRCSVVILTKVAITTKKENGHIKSETVSSVINEWYMTPLQKKLILNSRDN